MCTSGPEYSNTRDRKSYRPTSHWNLTKNTTPLIILFGFSGIVLQPLISLLLFCYFVLFIPFFGLLFIISLSFSLTQTLAYIDSHSFIPFLSVVSIHIYIFYFSFVHSFNLIPNWRTPWCWWNFFILIIVYLCDISKSVFTFQSLWFWQLFLCKSLNVCNLKTQRRRNSHLRRGTEKLIFKLVQ